MNHSWKLIFAINSGISGCKLPINLRRTASKRYIQIINLIIDDTVTCSTRLCVHIQRTTFANFFFNTLFNLPPIFPILLLVTFTYITSRNQLTLSVRQLDRVSTVEACSEFHFQTMNSSFTRNLISLTSRTIPISKMEQ